MTGFDEFLRITPGVRATGTTGGKNKLKRGGALAPSLGKNTEGIRNRTFRPDSSTTNEGLVNVIF